MTAIIFELFAAAYAEAARDATLDKPTALVAGDGVATVIVDVHHRPRIRRKVLDDGTTVWRGLCTCRRGIEATRWRYVLVAVEEHLADVNGYLEPDWPHPAFAQGDPA